jgi:hypothetical protein
MADEHEGPGHGEATLSLTEVRPDGSRLTQSWTICDCTLPQLRARWGAPGWKAVATKEATEEIGRTVLSQPGSVQFGPGGWRPLRGLSFTR